MEITASAQADNIKEIESLAANWNSFGFQSTLPALPTRCREHRRAEGHLHWHAGLARLEPHQRDRGFQHRPDPVRAHPLEGPQLRRLYKLGYDRLYTEYSITLEPEKSQSLLGQMMRVVADDVLAIPMYYVLLGLAYRKGVEGPVLWPPIRPPMAGMPTPGRSSSRRDRGQTDAIRQREPG